MKIREGWVVAALGVLGACGDKTYPSVDAAPVDPYTVVVELPITIKRDLDVLFVVDDSPGMLDKQINLRNNFPTFVNVLATLPGGLPNLHLGVVTTDMGTSAADGSVGPAIGSGQGSCAMRGKNGALQKGMSGGAVVGAFISDTSPGPGMPRQTNYGEPSTLSEVFGQLAQVGANGCGFEQSVLAARTALTPSTVANQGFLRREAVLAVVFVTDEDDCSLKNTALLGPESPALGPLQSFRCTRFGVRCAVGGGDVNQMNQIGVKEQCGTNPDSQYLDDVDALHDFLVNLKTDPRSVIVAGLMGPAAPFEVVSVTPPGGGTPQIALANSCTYQSPASVEVATPPARLHSLMAMFPGRSTSGSICKQDVSAELAQIGQLIVSAMGSPCLSAQPIDSDPAIAGVQFDCKVDDIVGTTATPLVACDGQLTPTCWTFETDAASCPATTDHYKLVVHRGTTTPPSGTVTRVKCRVSP